MIELIFAIVIMGIVMMSAPQLIATATKSGYTAIQQEGINEAASRIHTIMSQNAWDENNAWDRNTSDIILQAGTTADLKETNISGIPTGRRLGMPKRSGRSFVSGLSERASASLSSAFGPTADGDSAEEDDIDDYSTSTILKEEESSSANYLETTTISIATEVAYIPDVQSGGDFNSSTITYNPNFSANSTNSNVKRISATLTSTSGIDELNKTIILHAFSCNIGDSGEPYPYTQ